MIGQRKPLVDTSLQQEHQFYMKADRSYLKQCKNRRFLSVLAILCLISLGVWLYVYNTSSLFNQYRLVKRFYETSIDYSKNKTRFILLWNAFFDNDRWYLPDDVNAPSYFRKESHCHVWNCVVTNKRDILPRIELYDAILFHTARSFPLFNPIPKHRSSKQLYVFTILEPPTETKHVLSDENNFYNLTMTYRMDSDILWTYNDFVDKETNQRIIPNEYPQWRSVPNSYNDSVLWNLWPFKRKMAAWFVSHCSTLSRREKLVQNIQNYMEVDVYGKCGPNRCEKGSSECDKLLDENYKFYFSFENSLCTDYITEKLYNIMKRNLVPLVYGGANYKHFLPPHSYINVEDYETPLDLVNYLKYLSENPEAYMRYFWWRQYYDLKDYSPFCDLCQRLHQPNYFLKTQTYKNIEKWWLDGSCRFKSRIKF